MKRSFVKKISLAAAVVLSAVLAAGCKNSADSAGSANRTESAENRSPGTVKEESAQTVSVALWGAQLLESYAPWLQEQYPDVDFDFYIATNRTEYFDFCAKTGTLPDILTVRRFSLHDMDGIRDNLLDLSDTELAHSFYQSYLKNYTYSDGTINWLPSAAELYTLMANKTLFEENSIPLPTDWDSFVYACEEFKKLGIRGFSADFIQDYACMNNLQGLSISQLTSTEGREWRNQYESGLTHELDRDVWMPAFEKMMTLFACAGLDGANLALSTADISNGFENGEIAMICMSSSEFTDYSANQEKILLPYPGETAEDGWYLTCPSFQIAANAECSKDPEREKLIVDIMTTMLNREGLSHISTGKNMVAYNRNVDLELLDGLSNLKPYIEENKLYIRLASSDMFSISKDVVTRMLTGEITSAEEAFDAFNQELANGNTQTQPTVMHLDRSYSHAFRNGSGNEAASAIYNTVREELGVDCVIGQSAIVGGDIPEGDYNQDEMSYVAVGWDGGTLLKKDLTGSELKSVVQYFLDAKGLRDSVANNSTLPVSSGFEMELTKGDDGYTVDRLTVNGEEMRDDRTYSVVVRINYRFNVANFEEAGFTGYEKLDTKLNTLVKTRLIEEGGQLTEPSDYITVD